MPPTLAATLAECTLGTASAAIPLPVVAAARAAAGDGLACMLAGARAPVTRIVAGACAPVAGDRATTVVGAAGRYAAADAAMINATACHAYDFDDISWSLYGHATAAVLPAALAAAELAGADGHALVDAYVIGVEVAARLGLAANPWHYEHGWHATSTLGVFGATAAAARLLDATPAQAAAAFGIAASLAGGLQQNFGSMTKPFHAGHANRAALLAVQLALGGMDASPLALEGPRGWFAVLADGRAPDAVALAAAFGRPWQIVEPGLALKRYPSCGATHCALDAVLEIGDRGAFDWNDVADVDCRAHPLAVDVLLHARPATALEAKFSMQFCLAVALIDGAPSLAHFSPEWIHDVRVQALLPRIRMTAEPALAAQPAADAMAATIAIRWRDGRREEATVRVPLGDPRRPLSASQRAAKFAACAAGVLDPAAAAALAALVEAVDAAPDLRPLLAALAGTPH